MDHSYPELLEIPNFLVEFITPIVKAKKGAKELAFYTMPQYEEWKAQIGDEKGWTTKYFKVSVGYPSLGAWLMPIRVWVRASRKTPRNTSAIWAVTGFSSRLPRQRTRL